MHLNANTIGALDTPALHMHDIISSNNERQVCEWHVACRALHSPKTSRYLVCIYGAQLAACVQVLSGPQRVRYQMRRLFICANNPFVTGIGDTMYEHTHALLLTTAKVNRVVLAAADRPE